MPTWDAIVQSQGEPICALWTKNDRVRSGQAACASMQLLLGPLTPETAFPWIPHDSIPAVEQRHPAWHHSFPVYMLHCDWNTPVGTRFSPALCNTLHTSHTEDCQHPFGIFEGKVWTWGKPIGYLQWQHLQGVVDSHQPSVAWRWCVPCSTLTSTAHTLVHWMHSWIHWHLIVQSWLQLSHFQACSGW